MPGFFPTLGSRGCVHELGGKLKSAPKISVSFPPLVRKHVVHQIGIDVAAETYRVLKARCEQQHLPAHDTNDPHRRPWGGAENSRGRELQLRQYTQTRVQKNQRERTNASTPALQC